MDYSKTQVFKINGNEIDDKSTEREFIEKDVQKFYENNLNELLGAEFIQTEYAIEGGRLDTFAIDHDFRPVIIEYKRDTSDSVLLQALFYKNFIRKNWEKAYLTIMEKKGKEIADKIDFTNIRVILVAQRYDKWTLASSSFLDGVELYSFAFYEKTFIQEFLNEPKTNKRKKSIVKETKDGENYEYVSVLDADYSVDERVITKYGKEDVTNVYKYNRTSDSLKAMYDEINEYAMSRYSQTELIYNKNYWMFKSKKKYLEVIFQNKAMILQLNLPQEIADSFDDIKDLRDQGSWGSLEFAIRVNDKTGIKRIKYLIEQSFLLTNGSQLLQ